MKYNIDTKYAGWTADSSDEVLSIIKQIRNAGDPYNSGIGYKTYVTVNHTQYTIEKWITDFSMLIKQV